MVALLGVLAAGCGGAGAETGKSGGPVEVAVSIAPQRAFVEAIGGDHVNVTVMVPKGSEPATYEPTPRRVASLSSSEAYFGIDVPFERAWLPRFESAAEDMRVVDTTRGIDRRQLEEDQPDPHIWLDPTLVREQARTYADALADLDPAHASAYRQRLARFQDTVDEVDGDLRTTLRPHRGETVMIFHPVLNYFADEYGLDVINIEESGSEPSPADMSRIIAAGRDAGVSVVFVEPQFSQRAARTIAGQLDAEVATLDPLAEDWAANMRRIGESVAAGVSGP